MADPRVKYQRTPVDVLLQYRQSQEKFVSHAITGTAITGTMVDTSGSTDGVTPGRRSRNGRVPPDDPSDISISHPK
jgi:hypothetical protein